MERIEIEEYRAINEKTRNSVANAGRKGFVSSLIFGPVELQSILNKTRFINCTPN
jgi:hypothetical protein